MNNVTSEFSDPSIAPPALDAQELQAAGKSGASEVFSQKNLRPNRFSFSKLFTPVTPRPQTPLGSSESKWSSRVSSFVGSFFDQRTTETPSMSEHFTVESSHLEDTIVCSSPETVKVLSATPLSFDSLTSIDGHSSPEEMTLPQQSFFEAGEQDRRFFVASLMEELQKTGASDDQVKKDIDRISYFLNGKRVRDVESIRNFLGEAAGSVLPILSQTIPNTATDIVVQHILNAAPVNTTHAELAMSGGEKNGTSISISKREGSPDFHIEVETKGSSTVFLKKVERGGTPDFEMITLSEEDDSSPQPRLFGEGRQFIALELTKDDAGLYSLSCVNLLRKYVIQSSHS